MGEVALDDVSARLVGMLAANMTRVIDLFREWDLNGDHLVTIGEFRKAVPHLGLQACAAHAASAGRVRVHVRLRGARAPRSAAAGESVARDRRVGLRGV